MHSVQLLRFQRLLQYPSGLINVVWTPSVQLNVAHPRNCAHNMNLLIVFLCSMYNYDITKYLESLEIKNNFLSGLLSMQPPTREIIGEKPNQCTHNRLTMRLTELNICLICVVDMWFNYKKLCLLFVFWINILYFVLYLPSIVRLVTNNWKFVCTCCGGKNERLLETWKPDSVSEFRTGREDDGNWIINPLN